MDIKPRYDELRMGAMFIEPVKATESDLTDFVMATRTGGSSQRIYQFMIDCRALAGKLFNDKRVEDLIVKTPNDFILKIKVIHPKIEQYLIIGGSESKTIAVFRDRKIEPYLKKIEVWVKKYFSDISPVEHLLKYGRQHKYGLKVHNGLLTYVMIASGGYSERDNPIYGQPYTEASWGYDD